MENKRNILKFICGVLIGGLILFWGALNGRTSKTEIPKEAKSLVKIYTREGYGTGIILEKNSEGMIIASNLHVISGWDETGYVEFYDGLQVFGQQFGADEPYDVDFLSVPVTEFEEGMDRYPAVNIAVEDTDEDADENRSDAGKVDIITYDIFALNNGNGGLKKVTGDMERNITYIYDLERSMYLGNLDSKLLTEGMSGSGIFTDAGCVGILTAGNEEGVVAITPIDDIQKCLGPNLY